MKELRDEILIWQVRRSVESTLRKDRHLFAEPEEKRKERISETNKYFEELINYYELAKLDK